jgi:hypothetical protein
MKKTIAIITLALCAGLAAAVDFDSFSLNDLLLSYSRPAAPRPFEDAVVFTASGQAKRVGVAFAHEGFAAVHWFKRLLRPGDGPAILAGETIKPDDIAAAFVDSGILFYVYEYPRGTRELAYRLVVDGLWTTDPWNPVKRIDPASGVSHSVVAVPPSKELPSALDSPAGCLEFNYKAAPGESVTVAGSFNNWDPFMYELNEQSPGFYSLTLPLPPGKYEYAYYYRGERLLDPTNPNKVYTREGKTASQAAVN